MSADDAAYNQALGDARQAIERLIESSLKYDRHSFHAMAAAIDKRTVLASAIAVIDQLHKPPANLRRMLLND